MSRLEWFDWMAVLFALWLIPRGFMEFGHVNLMVYLGALASAWNLSRIVSLLLGDGP
jgi:hypothetical protein